MAARRPKKIHRRNHQRPAQVLQGTPVTCRQSHLPASATVVPAAVAAVGTAAFDAASAERFVRMLKFSTFCVREGGEVNSDPSNNGDPSICFNSGAAWSASPDTFT